MNKGIVVIDIPHNCFKCKLKRRPYGMSFPEDMICGITEQSIHQYKPNNINGTKPEWCPIKDVHDIIQDKSESKYGLYILGWNDCLDEIFKDCE